LYHHNTDQRLIIIITAAPSSCLLSTRAPCGIRATWGRRSGQTVELLLLLLLFAVPYRLESPPETRSGPRRVSRYAQIIAPFFLQIHLINSPFFCKSWERLSSAIRFLSRHVRKFNPSVSIGGFFFQQQIISGNSKIHLPSQTDQCRQGRRSSFIVTFFRFQFTP
jgi:hypothetical protein